VDSGGFDETNVTEDFATSFIMHSRGWDSLYLNRTYVYSLAPENLAAYFTQQSRWSFGTLGTSRLFIKTFVKNPRALRFGQWWEYFLSATYYWVGWVNFFFILLPLLYLFFNIKPLRQDVLTYLLVFLPYMLFTLNMFYTGMGSRGYRLSETVLGQQIGFISFPIHMSSAVAGVLGQKRRAHSLAGTVAATGATGPVGARVHAGNVSLLRGIGQKHDGGCHQLDVGALSCVDAVEFVSPQHARA
jgi:cellulose synthase (UDP-forming)